jgi:hypothetical protein
MDMHKESLKRPTQSPAHDKQTPSRIMTMHQSRAILPAASTAKNPTKPRQSISANPRFAEIND